MNRKLSIKNRLVTCFGIILISSLIVSGLVSNYLCYDIVEKNKLDSLQDLATATAHKIDVILEEKVNKLNVPVRNTQNEVIGMLVGVNKMDLLEDVLRDRFTINEYMLLDSKGYIRVHQNEMILEEQIPMEEMLENESYESVYNLHKAMLNGEMGAAIYTAPVTKLESYVGYAPIMGGWSIGLINYKSEVLEDLKPFNINLIISMLIIAILSIGVVYSVATILSKNMQEIVNCLDIVANGDFNEPIPSGLLELNDELGDAARALRHMKVELGDMLLTIRDCTNYMNEQVEDLTEEVKEAIKKTLNVADSVDEESACQEIIQRIQELNRRHEVMYEFAPMIEDKKK